jgi:hypothetical protein
MRLDLNFQKTWNKTRSDFQRADGEPDKSKYELAIAERALRCGCSVAETETLIRYWYTMHLLDSSGLSPSRMRLTIDTTLARTAAYGAKWQARQSQRKPKLRAIILEFAAGRVSFSGNQILSAFDGRSDKPSHGAMRQILSVLTTEGLIGRVSRGRYALVTAQPAAPAVSRVHTTAPDCAGRKPMRQAEAA